MTRLMTLPATALLGVVVAGAPLAPANAAGDPSAIEQGDTRSSTDTAVGVIAGLGALAAGSGLVVVARRKRV